jgi:hypothetical protein
MAAGLLPDQQSELGDAGYWWGHYQQSAIGPHDGVLHPKQNVRRPLEQVASLFTIAHGDHMRLKQLTASLAVIAAASLGNLAFAGGPVEILWNNDGSSVSSELSAPFFGTNGIRLADNTLIQLVAVNPTTTNTFALATGSLGQDAGTLAGASNDSDLTGLFNLSNTISSNVLASALSSGYSVLGVVFFSENGSQSGLVFNASVAVPSPNYIVADPNIPKFTIDWYDGGYVAGWGAIKTSEALHGYQLIPEPSSFALVGLGLLALIRLRRRQ